MSFDGQQISYDAIGNPVTYLGATGTVLSYNLFAYCENDAVNCVDESGTAKKDDFEQYIRRQYKTYLLSSKIKAGDKLKWENQKLSLEIKGNTIVG